MLHSCWRIFFCDVWFWTKEFEFKFYFKNEFENCFGKIKRKNLSFPLPLLLSACFGLAPPHPLFSFLGHRPGQARLSASSPTARSILSSLSLGTVFHRVAPAPTFPTPSPRTSDSSGAPAPKPPFLSLTSFLPCLALLARREQSPENHRRPRVATEFWAVFAQLRAVVSITYFPASSRCSSRFVSWS